MDCRIFSKKKKNFNSESEKLKNELEQIFDLTIPNLEIYSVYDVFNISNELLDFAKDHIFSDSFSDDVYICTKSPYIPEIDFGKHFAIEFLKAQFDARADSAVQCLSLLACSEVKIRSSKIYSFTNCPSITNDKINSFKKYLLNKVECQEKDLSKFEDDNFIPNKEILQINDFVKMNEEELQKLYSKMQLSISFEDLKYIQDYFANTEKRDPNLIEIKLLDTYWSDHCRHTSFETELTNISFPKSKIGNLIENSYEEYKFMKNILNQNYKPTTLMSMATINSKYEYKNGNLSDLEIQEENNACCININVDNDNKNEDWLLLFKNETHNHPTEIEPFGGAATCLGGAIRDPLSARSYVFQALRLSGASDITENIKNTMQGKLPQFTISKKAAEGFSSYGNQIGLSTSLVSEVYHKNFVAKRMEVGAVVGAVKKENITHQSPSNGDIILIIGGKTGKDGIGGASGSSKIHNSLSLENCSAEVQKGNPVEERKIQRLFKNPKATLLIKKANDFGAGGVSVAIGELASGIEINLDLIPLKYQGLTETEIAISESQERMAILVAKENVQQIIEYANQENLDAIPVAKVNNTNRLSMFYKDEIVVDINRAFIDTNGIRQKTNVVIEEPKGNFLELNQDDNYLGTKSFPEILNGLNTSLQKGLGQMFDSTVGNSTVIFPYGGINQASPSQVAVQKIPVPSGKTKTCSMLSFGYNPYICQWSPFHGAVYAIVDAISKIVAQGGDYKKTRFSCQEYFGKPLHDEKKWGQVCAALLGSIKILKDFELASIGGKDSMSGSFNEIDVPPSFIAFSVCTQNTDNVISSDLKKENNYLYFFNFDFDDSYYPNIQKLKNDFDFIYSKILDKTIVSSFSVQYGGIAEAISKMAFGNNLGVKLNNQIDLSQIDLYRMNSGIIVESQEKLFNPNAILLGNVIQESIIINNNIYKTKHLYQTSISRFENIFPISQNNYFNINIANNNLKKFNNNCKIITNSEFKKVKVFVPVFPGTNCECETANAFLQYGADVTQVVFKNKNSFDIAESVEIFAEQINQSDILVLSGGFSAGDEPDGSGKFISIILENNKIAIQIDRLLERKGLILGICNGFQALLKSNLLPACSNIKKRTTSLITNDIAHHISAYTFTKVSSINSFWTNSFSIGDVFNIPISHGEGKFVSDEKTVIELFENGQIAFQYCDFNGNTNITNPNGSYYNIEGISSKNGQILGKMAHSERACFDNNYRNTICKNIYGNKHQSIFYNALNYLSTIKS